MILFRGEIQAMPTLISRIVLIQALPPIIRFATKYGSRLINGTRPRQLPTEQPIPTIGPTEPSRSATFDRLPFTRLGMSWGFTIRTRQMRSICFAIRGRCSLTGSPGTTLLMGLCGPRISAGAPGFISNVSI